MIAAVKSLDRILRGEATSRPTLRHGRGEIALPQLTLVLMALAVVYGLCMGSFALIRGGSDGLYQFLASGVKVPALFFLTLVITFPSLYVFNALVGSRLQVFDVLWALIAAVGVNIAVLASLGPIVAFFSVSTTNYPFMLLLNVAVFAVSGLLGLAFLMRTVNRTSPAGSDSPPGASDPSQGEMPNPQVGRVFRIWVVVFGLVGAQMGWVLRPFVGNPNQPFTFLRPQESNFFQSVLESFWALFQ